MFLVEFSLYLWWTSDCLGLLPAFGICLGMAPQCSTRDWRGYFGFYWKGDHIYSVLCKRDMLTLNSHLSYIYIYIYLYYISCILSYNIIHHVCPGKLGAKRFHLVQPNKAWFVAHIPVVCCSQPIVHCCIVLLQWNLLVSLKMMIYYLMKCPNQWYSIII